MPHADRAAGHAPFPRRHFFEHNGERHVGAGVRAAILTNAHVRDVRARHTIATSRVHLPAKEASPCGDSHTVLLSVDRILDVPLNFGLGPRSTPTFLNLIRLRRSKPARVHIGVL